MLKPISLLALSVLIGVGQSMSAQQVVASSSTMQDSSRPTAHALQISPGDLLDLNVFDTPELSGRLRVDEHGNISLPLAGVLSVSGMTAEQAGLAIEAQLRQTDVLKDPHV